METKKVLAIIFSIVFVLAFGFVLAWGIINFNKVKEGISGTELYTYEDIKNSYQDGYDTALSDKEEYEKLINSYRDTITTQTDEISKLNSQVSTLTNSNKDKEQSIINLQKQKETLQIQVDNLSSLTNENNSTITELNAKIVNLQKEINLLKIGEQDMTEEIASKNNQIATLQSINSQLQKTNALNANTITSLNNQIVDLNKQISDLSLAMNNNNNTINTLNSRIIELEKSVAYYEQYIANLESGEQVVATFEFNGSVYNIQILNKGDRATVTTPTSTDYIIFNHWTVNGEIVDLSTYTINTNTKFVADITYYYDVIFNVDGSEHDKQIILLNDYPQIPANPVKEGYEFDGWTSNGVDVIDISNKAIDSNTTYIAKFTQLHEVVFMVDNQIWNSQIVRNGEKPIVPEGPNKEGFSFDGWQANEIIVDVSGEIITSSKVFVAKFTELVGAFDSETGAQLLSWTEIIEDDYLVLSEDGVLTAGANATSLAGDLILPDTITEIGKNCFYDCNDITSVVMAEGVHTIQDFGFYRCTGLKSVTIPKTMTTIDSGFDFCENLEAVYVSDIARWSSITFSGNGLLNYAKNIYVNNELLTELIVDETFSTINDYAFRGLTSLTKMVVKSNSIVPTIGSYCFSGCTNLKSLIIEEGAKLEKINWQGFQDCSGMTELKILNELKTLGGNAFVNCKGIVDLYVSRIETWLNMTFSNHSDIFFNESLNFYVGDELLTDLIIPEGISTINGYAFRNYTKLKTVSLPSSVISIGTMAFYNCKGLTSVTFAEGLETIGDSAFELCKKLENITLPASLKTIGSEVFRDCSVITSIIIPKNVTWIGRYCFAGCSNITTITLEFRGGYVNGVNYKWYYSKYENFSSAGASGTYPENMVTHFTDTFVNYYWKLREN